MPSANDPADTSETREPNYVSTFDPGAEPASEAVVRAIAALVDSNPIDLTPLYRVVDPEALDSMIEHAARLDGDERQQFRFTYEGFDVGVLSDGRVRIHDAVANRDA